MAQNLKITIIHGNVNFIGECSSRAHFENNLMLIKNHIGSMPKKTRFHFTRAGILKEAVYCTPSYKIVTFNFTGIVTIQFLINITLSIK